MSNRVRHRTEQGMALIVVVWIAAVISLISIGIIQLTRLGADIVSVDERAIRAKTAMQGSLLVAAERLASTKDSGTSFPITFEQTVGSVDVSVRITPEADKIDLNIASVESLKSLFVLFGASDSEAQGIAAAVVDWRDSDQVPEYFGAEAPDYMDSVEDFRPRNGFFESTGELRWVKGMTDALFNCIVPYTTVHSHRVSNNIAQLLPASTKRAGEKPIAPKSIIHPDRGFNGKAFTIELEALTGDVLVRRRAVIRITGAADDPFWLLGWSEYVPDVNICTIMSESR